MLAKELTGRLEGKRVAVLGLAFKAGTDDVRNSVSIDIVQALLKQKAVVRVYDPKAMENAKTMLDSEGVSYVPTALDCLKGADCCIIATPWKEFSRIAPSDFKSLMRNPTVVDGSRIYDSSEMLEGGIIYASVGISLQEDYPGEPEIRLFRDDPTS